MMIPISTAAFYGRSSAALGDLRARAEALQTQISGGSRLARSSDDPVAASRLRSLAQTSAIGMVNAANADRATADLTLTDAALASFADFVNRARELALQAANGTLNDPQRAAIGSELSQIHGNLVALANMRDSSGHSLFGGDATGSAYIKDASGNAVYAGTANSPQLDLGDGVSVARTLTGPEFLTVPSGGGSTDLMAVVKQLADGLQAGAGAQAAALNAIAALDAGTTAISTAQAVVGSRQSWTDMTVQRQQKMSELRDTETASLQGGDIAANVVDLQQIMTVLQASQASFAKLASLSLFDALR